MLKKLVLLAMSVAALVALVGPAAAQAEGPLVTDSNGGSPTNLFGEGTDVTTVTKNGTLECATVSINIKTTQNSETTYTGHGTGTASGNPATEPPHAENETCRSSSGATVKITSITIHDIHLTKGGTNSAIFTYTYQLYSHAFSTSSPVAACSFEGTVGVTTGESSISVEGGITGGGTALCPTTGEITGVFDVFDETGEPATIH